MNRIQAYRVGRNDIRQYGISYHPRSCNVYIMLPTKFFYIFSGFSFNYLSSFVKIVFIKKMP